MNGNGPPAFLDLNSESETLNPKPYFRLNNHKQVSGKVRSCFLDGSRFDPSSNLKQGPASLNPKPLYEPESKLRTGRYIGNYGGDHSGGYQGP